MAVNLELDERDEGSFRRSWSAAFKKRILEEIDAAPAGEKGVILRREKLYSSTVARWRRQRESGALDGLGRKRGPKPVDGAREIARLKRENARLSERLGGLEALLEAQGKVYALLRGLSRESDETK